MVPDILLYIGAGENEELRYALRTWVKYLKFNRLIVVGGPKPKWFYPDIYIENPVRYGKMRQCYDDLVKALKTPDLTDEIILMMDDIFLLAPCNSWKINYNRGTLKRQWERSLRNHGATSYNQIVKNTYLELIKTFPDPLSFEEHAPFRCDKKKLLAILEEYGPERMDNLLYRSIYGNRYCNSSAYKKDLKLTTMRMVVPKDALLFSTDSLSFRGNAGSYVKFNFPKKSRYER